MFIILQIILILFEKLNCAGVISPATFEVYLPPKPYEKKLTTLKLNTEYYIKFDFKLQNPLSSGNDYLRINIKGFKVTKCQDQSNHFTRISCDLAATQIEYKVNTDNSDGPQYIYFFASTGASKILHTISAFTYNAIDTNIVDQLPDYEFTVERGTIIFDGLIIVPNKRIGQKSNYNINLKFENPLPENSILQFTSPKNEILPKQDQDCEIQCLPSPISCKYTKSDNLITISKLQVNKQETKTISLEFTNPLSKIQIIAFSNFISFIGSDQVDSSSTSESVTDYNDGILTDVTIESGDYLVGKITSIIYKFTNLNYILDDSQIELTLPDDIQWIQSSISCELNLGTCTFKKLELQVLTVNINTLTPIKSGMIINLKINSIRSPYTLKPVSKFKFIIYKNSDSYDYNENKGTLTMKDQSGIYLKYIKRSNHKNGEISDYQFLINFDTLQPKGTKLTFTLIGYNLGSVDNVKFKDKEFKSRPSLEITSSTNMISLYFDEDIEGNIPYDTFIYKIQNLDSSIKGKITAETSLDNYKISSTDFGTSGIIEESSPNDITIQNMIQDYGFLGEIDSYQFIINLINPLTNGCQIIVTMPDDFQTAMTEDCTSAVDNYNQFTLGTCSVNSKDIIITTKTTTYSKVIQFKLKNLIKNPKTYSSSKFFRIKTQKNSYTMDESQIEDDKLKFQIKCSSIYPLSYCKECDTNNNCLSCYSDTITKNIYLLNNKCEINCGQQYYPDSNNKCQSCPNNCLECSNSQCTSCLNVTTQEIKNGKCVLKCTEKQFDFNGICTDCNQNCNTCVGQSTKCTSCGVENRLLYENKCVSQCPTEIFQVGFSCIACTSPCKTCDTGPKVCLSCVANYYYKKALLICVSDCGNRYYKDGSECTLCSDPCNNCSSNTICIDCLSGYYFFNNTCVSTIPDGYYLSETSLIQCPIICKNCISETECTSCPTNQYLLSKQCIDKCPDNHYSQNFVCYPCDTSCLKCSSITLCTQCPENQQHLSGKCYSTCPSKYYSQELQCLPCESSCSTCVNGLECKTCPIKTPYLLNNLCVQSCLTNYYINSFVCYQCQNECATCDEKGCLTCIQNYKYFDKTCLTSCPSGYKDLNIQGICDKMTEAEEQVISNLHENKYIPIPFTIVSLIMILSVVVAKIQKSETYIPGSTVGLLGLIIIGSWVVLLILQLDYILEKVETSLLMTAIGVHIILNLINLCVVITSIQGDIAFNLWYTSSKSNSCAFIFLNIISIISFSMTRFYFSRYFGFNFLKCKLSDIEHMIGMNIINGFCAFFCCIPALIACVLLAYRDQLREQLFISSIDSFIVTIIFGISLIWETKKEVDFFEDKNIEIVSQQHKIIPEFFQSQRSKQSKRFSFEESLNGQKFNPHEQDEEPSFPKIEESIDYKQQPFQKMLQKNSQFSFKQQIPNIKQNIFNRQQEEIILEINNKEVSESLSIGNSQREIQDISQQQKFEQQQQKILEEQQSIEFEKRQKEIMKQEQERLAELKRLEALQKQEEQKLKQEEIQQQEQERIRKQLIQQEQEAERLEKINEEKRLAELAQLEEQNKINELRKIEEEQQAERLRQEEERKIQEELKIKEQEEEAKRIQDEQKKLEELKLQEELDKKKKEQEIQQVLEEQNQQEQKEQEIIQKSMQSNQNSEIQVKQNQIEDLKQEINEFDQTKNNNRLNDIILVDQYDDDVGWNIENDEKDYQDNVESLTTQQNKKKKEIILVDKNDGDDNWDVQTSGFVSMQPQSKLRKDLEIDEPKNPFQGQIQRQAAESDLFKQSRNDTDDEDWAANQVSPSEFNFLNQRFDHDRNSMNQADISKNFFQTGQNFKSITKRPTLPNPLITSDNESIDQQQQAFDQFPQNQLSQRSKKQNKGLKKIYLQRQRVKQKGANNIGINDIKF